MKTFTISRKMSGTGTIHDIASDLFDRDINFRKDCKYAVVLAAFYGGKGYTTHRTAQATIAQANRMSEYSYKIIDIDGWTYDICGDQLIADRHIQEN